jgi:hypothetical protein
MPQWNPKPIWKGEDVFIIGGGTSLRNFDWTLLYNEKTIGCNQAFRLGEKVCDICLIGDKKFLFEGGDLSKPYLSNYSPLSEFGNPVVVCDPVLHNRPEPWMLFMQREPKGISKDALGWNTNTGASAINLALILRAKNIYLLGFDMKLDENGKPNWHNEKLIDKPEESTYERMLSYYGRIKHEINKKFPGVKVIHLLTGESKLKTFKRVDAKLFFDERKNCD